jgi:transcription-repair coupling factor (superfamily II helicase)
MSTKVIIDIDLSGILSLLHRMPSYRRLAADLAASPPVLPADERPLGALSAARPALLAALHAHTKRPLLVVVARADAARSLVRQLRIWSPFPRSVHLLPHPDALPYERVPWGRDTIYERVRSLVAMANWQGSDSGVRPPLVVASARALMQHTAPPGELGAHVRRLQVGQRLALEEELRHWVDMGYQASPMVEEPGAFSRRGGIIDVYSPAEPYPVRIDLFGDEIDSLRAFDPITQRSEHRLQQFEVYPAHEALAHLAPAAAAALAQLDCSGCLPSFLAEFDEEKTRLTSAAIFRGVEFYLPFFYPQPASPLDYLPEDGLLLVEDVVELGAVMAEVAEQAEMLRADLVHQGELPADLPRPYFDRDELASGIRARPHVIVGRHGWDMAAREPEEAEEGPLAQLFKPADVYGGQLKPLVEELIQAHRSQTCTVIISRQASRIGDLLEEKGVAFSSGVLLSPGDDMRQVMESPSGAEVEYLQPAPGHIHLVQGMLSEGWMLEGIEGDGLPKFTMLTDTEVFGYRKPEPRRRPVLQRGVAPESFFADLKPGDYVVHVEHGIGIFHGLVKLDLTGVESEFLRVDYAANDKLYVPTHQADRLSRYVGVDDRPPQIHRLGATDWAQVKRRARRAVEDIAAELLEIYAARESAGGYTFSEDTPWQHELEASFPYVETEDQLLAIEAVKRDMERSRPMDRLICGDVGYGKTEVALRAAFKAVNDGKQVAVLVPTTVLAQQHFHTFSERLKPFPVNVEMLSRFRSRKEQKRILDALARGQMDIVIGTHRLLQRDIRFKDLGLLIIDEEQRFGVSHKEQLKKLRTEVDVLTMTATPIPRTLHMALTGVRDLSTIDTPPAERLSIKTTVAEYDDTLVRTAILRELNRGGQVYLVHNRVMGIEQIAQRVAKLVPQARIAVAHGQMPEHRLERVMINFMNGRHDVLVCTSIIESGLDIPNVNTIIINRADQFGLAQLYQLRGRVGRGAVRAYAYLLIPKHWQPPEIVTKRLEAIAEASDLGAGFRIAMRDLEIRGAGDVLGARQHGHIAAVGFDLYTRLLAKTVRDMTQAAGRTEPREDALSYLAPLVDGVQLSLPLAAYLPEDYVTDASLRLQLYRRLAGLMGEEEVEAVRHELEDRFGPLPQPAENLLYQLRLKMLAMESGVQGINTDSGQIVVKAEGLEELNRDALQRFVGPQTRISRRQIWMPLDPNPEVWRTELERTLRQVHRMLHDPGR